MTSSGTPGRAHPPKADIGNRKINGAQTPLTVIAQALVLQSFTNALLQSFSPVSYTHLTLPTNREV